jgi:hypothetical protein
MDEPTETLLIEQSNDSLADELSIMELDDRLEFVAWCDVNCICGKKPGT